MPTGYSNTTGRPTGRAARKYFAGMTRECVTCNVAYEITESMAERRQYACPKCESMRAGEYAKNNREKKRAWNNAYSARNSANRAERTATWRANHPEKRIAHQAVQSAIRNGSLAKMPCEVCGTTERIHAHHDDYSKPLDVNWLCHSHHMERHAMLRARSQS